MSWKANVPFWSSFFYLPSVVRIAPGLVHPMLSHYYSVHPRLSTHHPRLYPYQSSALTCQDNLAKIQLQRVGGCYLYTLHDDTPSDPTSNSLASSSLKTGRFIFMWAPSSQCCLPLWECWDPSDLSDLYDIKEAVDNELLSFLNPWSGEGEGTWGDGGLWSLWCLLQSWPLRGWHGDGWWSEPPSLEASFTGEPLRCQTWRVVGPANLHMDVLAPLPSLSNLLKLGQWLLILLGLSCSQQQGRPIFQPMYLFLWEEMWHL